MVLFETISILVRVPPNPYAGGGSFDLYTMMQKTEK